MQFMFAYLYDAGDIWEHEIQLEEVGISQRDLPEPVLLSGEQACPPETMSDIHEYQSFLTSLQDSSGISRKKLSELTGSTTFDPDYFDLDGARHRLQGLK